MDLADAQFELVNLAHEIHARGWVPATSGNFSVRLADGDIAITVSGRDKGKLSAQDVMRMSADGEPVGAGEPSAEALLHAQLYRRDERISAILHTHSVNATLASQTDAKQLNFHRLEILKAFSDINTHDTSITIPIFDNDQHIESLAEDVERHMSEHDQGVAYLIAGHGVYTWGSGVDECMRHLEALEFLFDYARLSRAGVAG